MKSDFKVLDWVRRVRDRNAGEERNMSVRSAQSACGNAQSRLSRHFLPIILVRGGLRVQRTPASGKRLCVIAEGGGKGRTM
jgi:hypothetical protein